MTMSVETRDRIVALAKRGIRPARIFDLVGDARNLTQVYKTIGHARRIDPSIPSFRTARTSEVGPKVRNQFAVELPADLLLDLAPHAEKRRLTAKELAIALITVVVREDLVDATLDDGGAL